MSTIGLISRTAIFAFTWVILTEGTLDSWVVGLPAIVIALFVDYRLSQGDRIRWSLFGLTVYTLSFLKFSIIGGLDVVWRAYHPRMPLSPAIIEYPLRLSSSSARQLFMSTVSLLPGTLSVEIGEKKMIIHVLDARRPFDQELKLIEARVGAVFRFDP